MLRSTKFWILAGGVGASLMALNAPAKADIIPQLVSVTPSGSDFLWSYTATLTSEQFLKASTGPKDPGSYSAMGKKWHKHTTPPYAPYLDHGTPTSNLGTTIAPINPVPEPCSMALLGLGAAPLFGRLRRRSRKA